jgi:hypothetical protein
MTLSNQQIHRYARQIIVPGMGGRAQERLMSARLMLVGKAADVAIVFAYMVGAGVGEIRLRLLASDAAALNSLIMSAAQLNPDVVVKPAVENIEGLNLILAIGGDSEASALILSPSLVCSDVAMLFAHLGEPARIAILPARPPCPFCADVDLIAASTPREDNAGFVTMVAATEAFKLLACLAAPPPPTLLQFSGFACSTRALGQRLLSAECTCAMSTKAR